MQVPVAKRAASIVSIRSQAAHITDRASEPPAIPDMDKQSVVAVHLNHIWYDFINNALD